MVSKQGPRLPRFVLAALVMIAGVLPLAGGFLGVGKLSGLSGGLAHGSILIALDLPTLVEKSDHIAVVEVVNVTAAWDQRHERIYSTIELNVIEKWKSLAASPVPSGGNERLTIVQAGGTVGDIRMTVSGMGTFVPGERSLVFLRGPANRAQVVGMTQGKRAMRYLSSSRGWVVSPPDLRQAKLVRPPAGRPTDSRTDSTALASTPPTGRQVAATPSPAVQSRLVTPPTPIARELPLDDVRSEIMRLIGTPRP